MTDRESLDLFFDRRRAAMVEDIRALVRVDSVKGEAYPGAPFGSGPAAALDTALARREGFSARNVDGYVGVVDFNGAPTELGILAHLDVMPQGTGWTYPPFDVTEHEGRLYGRGTADDKGPAVAALYAMMAVKAIRPELAKNVRAAARTSPITLPGRPRRPMYSPPTGTSPSSTSRRAASRRCFGDAGPGRRREPGCCPW